MHNFKFDLAEIVVTPHFKSEDPGIQRTGAVQARSQHNDGRCDQYLVRYIDHNGREVEEWFGEDRLA